MHILEKIDNVLSAALLTESGVRNINQLAKDFDKAIAYFHMDLDGVTSCIGMKTYLERYGIKTIDAQPVQYGDLEYKLPMPPKGKKLLFYMVDFAHSKPMLNVWYDHHDTDHTGATPQMSTSFIKAPSNAGFISSVMSPSDLFPQEDLKLINTVDSADFASQGITPDEIMNSVFSLDPTIDVSKNRRAMGFVVNKLLLAYKNKKDFLKRLVLAAKPSLKSMYNIIVKLAEQEGYQTPSEYAENMGKYVEAQREKMKEGGLEDVVNLKAGESILIGNTIVQYSGGNMRYAYDRYTPFKLWPDADFIVIAWPMGMVQVSKNPFKSGDTPVHLGELMADAMEPLKSEMKNDIITLGQLKRYLEKDPKGKLEGRIMGFTFKDFIGLFKDVAKGLGSQKWSEILDSVAGKEYKYLSQKQKDLLEKVTVTAWDIMKAQSGGHKAISNGQLSAIPGNMKYLKPLFYNVAKLMKDKSLV